MDNDKNDKGVTKRLPKAHTRDGVIYTPSRYGPNGRDAAPARRKPVAEPIRPPARRKRSGYALFLVTTILIAVMGSVFLFTIIFQDFAGGRGDMAQATPPPETPIFTLPPTTPPPGQITVLGLVRHISLDSRRIDIYAIDTSENRSFFAEGSTDMRNRFGDAISLPEFSVGHVVELIHPENANTVTSIRISPQTMTYRNISDVVVDVENQELLIGMRRFYFTPNTITRYQGLAAHITEISPLDMMSVDILGERVMFVDIHRSHGFVQIAENHPIIGGRIELDDRIFSMIYEEGQEIKVREGEHRIIIRGDNIELFVDYINVAAGGIVIVNLDEIQFRMGDITVNIAQSGAEMTIDGEPHTPNEPISLAYGERILRVELEGFYTHEEAIFVGLAPQIINVNLQSIVLTRDISITTTPSEAVIYINNEFAGISPLIVPLTHGPHLITVSRHGYHSSTVPIHVTETSSHPLIRLQPDFRLPWFE